MFILNFCESNMKTTYWKTMKGNQTQKYNLWDKKITHICSTISCNSQDCSFYNYYVSEINPLTLNFSKFNILKQLKYVIEF